MDEGIAAGARVRQLALLLGIGLTTLQRWRRQFAGEGGGVECRKGSHRGTISPETGGIQNKGSKSWPRLEAL